MLFRLPCLLSVGVLLACSSESPAGNSLDGGRLKGDGGSGGTPTTTSNGDGWGGHGGWGGWGGWGGSAQGGNTTSGCQPDETVHKGQATWYELATELVNCSYETPTLPKHYGAMNTADYAGSATCGACVRVAGPKGSVDIQIVDQCPIDSNPICYEGHIDLNVPAFEQIADKVTGIVPIEWQFIACGVQGNLAYHFKTGSNAYWTAVQLRNHPYAISELAYKADNDNKFVALPRKSYNYFVAEQGMGAGPYTLRVTDIHGRVITDTNIALSPGETVPSQNQFPPCE